MMFFDPLYFLIVGPAIVLAIWAQFKVKSAFARFGEVVASARISGRDAALRILHAAGVDDVRVEETDGFLSDHYDPRTRTLRLSPDVYREGTISAIGVAAHEAGHAIQHAEHYPFLKMRNAIVPLANVGSWLAWPMIMLGLLLSMHQLALAGMIAFLALVVFQMITLPVELDASKRARALLTNVGIVHSAEEAAGVKKVLDAAALTYVAATVTAIAQLLYFAMRLGLFGRSSEE